MRIAFFGTPAFAVPTLERLLKSSHDVVAVLSQPDRPSGRGRKLSPSPVSQRALEQGLPLLRPKTMNAPEAFEALSRAQIDLGVVVAFGQFLPKKIREAGSLGYLINGHASLLPKYRGAAPIARAILEGETETGVSVMRIEREMDAGDTGIILRTPIGPEENAGQLFQRLAQLCAEAIDRAIASIACDEIRWTPQDPTQVSYAPKISKADSALRWEEPAKALVRRVRAMAPKPGAFGILQGSPLRILAASAETEATPVALPPGTVQWTKGTPMRIATGNGWLLPGQLQKAGGKPLDVEAFLCGTPIPDGTRFDPPDSGTETQ